MWTLEEENFLRQYYATHDTEELAIELERTMHAVRAKAIRMGLKKEVKTINEKGELACSICKRILNAEEHFHKSKTTSTGYAHACRFCNSDKQKQARKIEATKQKTEKEFYTCTKCNETKSGWHFSWNTGKMKRESQCQACNTKKDRISKVKRIKEGRDW